MVKKYISISFIVMALFVLSGHNFIPHHHTGPVHHFNHHGHQHSQEENGEPTLPFSEFNHEEPGFTFIKNSRNQITLSYQYLPHAALVNNKAVNIWQNCLSRYFVPPNKAGTYRFLLFSSVFLRGPPALA